MSAIGGKPKTIPFWLLSPHSAQAYIERKYSLSYPLSNRTSNKSSGLGELLYLRARLDNSTGEQLHDVVAQVYNLPLSYGIEKRPYLPSKCGKYPALVDLSFNNFYWQVLRSSDGTFYLYSAFFDNRTLTEPGPSVRILGMADRIKPAVKTHCQLWYEGQGTPVVAKVVEYRYIWVHDWGNYRNGILQPYLLQCVIPESHRHRVPQSVSLVEGSCDRATNNLRVVHNLPPDGKKKNFAVCVKGIAFSDDLSVKLVEWLELHFLLGVDKVFLYNLQIHPNVTKVLKFYESQGKVDLKGLTLPGEQPNFRGLLKKYIDKKITHKRQNEVIPYNDCLYRNMNIYKFITLTDTDEVIMPRTVPNWKELLEEVAPQAMSGENHPYASYYARNVYFLDPMQKKHGWAMDVPRFMHMLQHLYRSAKYTGPTSYIKAFHDPQVVLTLHNHFPFSCLTSKCPHYRIPIEVAHLQHYRVSCVAELRKMCHKFENDTVLGDDILRYKEPLLHGTLSTLQHLGFLQGRWRITQTKGHGPP
ncbi:hypothetical protein E2C01_029489 [Portunus trituberculatus]|uniref:Glycosyltransferase family 92 protein n=1 Tax=Portunus trituberculatus TaxID=210409 RepID=A0A5B7EUR1_PORTR|nr:hypothetical protein [Portunus trituberculatus]